ncbi:TetR family transcriptional regulator [Microbacterium sp. LRZ72]|uniref:TetR family transcriptional regulator n=1 Tax=Microbacterium sp. LRZ72 TaxID=2942481 RepID=UPI0029A8146C|nr:TetR family transcriptional regulator [Microbacterium sp. LRZ72]MDX2376084.1 TetR family transcriptional regulator [Microbacterium sp. LRZ72]
MRSEGDDLTTRARIRDAAIVAFGRRGFAGASLREIAKDAGVSPALVVHHFGGKDGLRSACDDFVVGSFMADKERLTGASASAMMRAALEDVEGRMPHLDYLARMLVDDGPAADELFDALYRGTREMLDQQADAGLLRQLDDPEMTAAYVTLYGIAPILMRRQLARAFGEDTLTPELMARSTLPVLELFTQGIYADDHLLSAARDALHRPERSGP